TICPDCGEPYHPTSEEIEQYFSTFTDNRNELQLNKGRGCRHCYESGYYGRKAVFEILSVSDEIRNMIQNGSSEDQIIKQAAEEGMKDLRQSGIDEVLNGTTTLQL
ncbi:MAG: ATPase, T2SS/T4P/T4SS family, partial [Planctomycetota bacterium]